MEQAINRLNRREGGLCPIEKLSSIPSPKVNLQKYLSDLGNYVLGNIKRDLGYFD